MEALPLLKISGLLLMHSLSHGLAIFHKIVLTYLLLCVKAILYLVKNLLNVLVHVMELLSVKRDQTFAIFQYSVQKI